MKHLLIDFENTQPADLNKIQEDDCQIRLFLGLHQQKSISLDLCESLCRFGKNVHFVRLEKTGKNALDFYLAFYIGRITQTDPEAQICILSKDGGFDPLVEHINGRHMADKVVRVKELGNKSVKVLGNSKDSTFQTAIITNNNAHNDTDDIVHIGIKKAIAYFSDSTPPYPENHKQLLKSLRKLLKNELKAQDKTARSQSVEKIATRLLQNGFISTDADHRLHYHFNNQHFEQRLSERVRMLKPRSRAALYNVIKSTATPEQECSEAFCAEIADKLAQHNIFTLHDNKISYSDELAEQAIMVEATEAAVIPTQQKTPQNTPPQTKTAARPNPESNPDNTSANLQKVVAVLKKISCNKPASPKSLQNSIVSWLRVTPETAATLLAQLQAHGHIELNGQKITYTLK